MLASVVVAAGVVLAGAAIAQPTQRQGQRATAYVPDPGPWRTLDSARVTDADGHDWIIRSDFRRLGTIAAERSDVAAVLPRIRFDLARGTDVTEVSVLLVTGNGEAALLPPHSSEESAVPSEQAEDRYGSWPNACALTLLDTSGALDLNGNGDPEIAVRRFCSCADDACAEILLLELRSGAGVTRITPGDLTQEVLLGRARIREIRPDGEPARPRLLVAPEILEGCAFLAAAGLPGENECADCCRFPVLLAPRADGGYAPAYDPALHKTWLDRARRDVDFAAAGDAARPPASAQLGQLGRAAAFFYLTGNGAQTRAELLAGLGPRGRDERVVAFLDRLEGIFLRRTTGIH